MKTTSIQRTLRAALASVLLSATFMAVTSGTTHASTAGPGGANVGFDFAWDDAANPGGHSAAFLEADGSTVNNCSGGPLTAATKTCNFVFTYSISGALQPTTKHAARYVSSWVNPPSYVAGAPVANTGCSSPTSGSGDLGKAPLTLFDCFNANSFGQVFRANTGGALTQFKVAMTCLAPGGSRYELYALMYEMSADGSTITGTAPVATTLVNLSSCPTASSWKGKAFAAKDFALIPLNLGNPDVTAGKFYGVFFTGPAMVGTAPVGATAAMQRAKAASTTTTTTTTTTPWSSFKNQNNTKKPATTTTIAKKTTSATTAPAVAAVPATLLPGNLSSESVRMSAVRVMNTGAEDTYVINSLTVNTCLGAGRNIVMLQNGRCTVQIAARRDGKVQTTISTKVVDGTVTVSDTVVAVAEPTVIKFRNGTALSTPAAKKVIANISSEARRATAVLVTGHTGNSGGETAKMTSLSQKRALAARSLLRDRGVTCVIAIQSYGATHTVSNSKKEAQQALNRRAEIYIVP